MFHKCYENHINVNGAIWREREEFKINVICCSIHDVLCAVCTNNTRLTKPRELEEKFKEKVATDTLHLTDTFFKYFCLLFTFSFAKKNGHLK